MLTSAKPNALRPPAAILTWTPSALLMAWLCLPGTRKGGLMPLAAAQPTQLVFTCIALSANLGLGWAALQAEEVVEQATRQGPGKHRSSLSRLDAPKRVEAQPLPVANEVGRHVGALEDGGVCR